MRLRQRLRGASRGWSEASRSQRQHVQTVYRCYFCGVKTEKATNTVLLALLDPEPFRTQTYACHSVCVEEARAAGVPPL
jgi:hypothetical protein